MLIVISHKQTKYKFKFQPIISLINIIHLKQLNTIKFKLNINYSKINIGNMTVCMKQIEFFDIHTFEHNL